MAQPTYYVYILMNAYHSVLYVGVTNDLARRISEHKRHLIPGFTKKYNVDNLVYYEWFTDINEAIKREKELKGWRRSKKLELIKTVNSELNDLSKVWI